LSSRRLLRPKSARLRKFEGRFKAQGKDRWAWAIFLKSNPQEAIGCVDIWRNGTLEKRGFRLGRKFWSQGIMTEAVEPELNFAFEKLEFEKLVFTNALGNTKSRRVKEKTGAHLIDVQPAKFVNPSCTMHEIWELTKEEWLAHRASK